MCVKWKTFSPPSLLFLYSFLYLDNTVSKFTVLHIINEHRILWEKMLSYHCFPEPWHFQSPVVQGYQLEVPVLGLALWKGTQLENFGLLRSSSSSSSGQAGWESPYCCAGLACLVRDWSAVAVPRDCIASSGSKMLEAVLLLLSKFPAIAIQHASKPCGGGWAVSPQLSSEEALFQFQIVHIGHYFKLELGLRHGMTTVAWTSTQFLSCVYFQLVVITGLVGKPCGWSL